VSESQTSATVSILEVPSSQVSRRFYKVAVKDSAGEAVEGVEVAIVLTGDGSFAPNFRSDDIRRVTETAGESGVFTWYRSGIYLRNCRSTITATAPEGHQVEIIETEDPQGEFKVSYVERPIRLPPQRV
jgi:hypothetical protein